MAGISNSKNGYRTIQFVGPDRKRRSIRLGKVSKKHAEAVKVKIECLVASNITKHALDDETARWVTNLDVNLTEKLAAAGLIAERVKRNLGDFLDSYIAKRNIKKENTLRNYKQTRNYLVDYFGASKNLRDISSGEADEWRDELRSSHSEATVSREVKRAKQFFRGALRKKLITENPFADLPTPLQVNKSREFFITREVAQDVIDTCPDHQWRLIFTLARFGGFRTPSEVLGLCWTDVDWENSRITIRAPKTEHHEDGGVRQIPIFPELRVHLEEAWDQTEDGAVYVVTRYRQQNSNLRTQLHRIIRKAGHEPWEKLFQNLRASRETELLEQFPIHVVCYWLGNSAKIAQKHYLQVTDDHFERGLEGGAKSGADVVRNTVQQPAASFRNAQKKTPQPVDKYGVTPFLATACETLQNALVPPRGVEPLLPD